MDAMHASSHNPWLQSILNDLQQRVRTAENGILAYDKRIWELRDLLREVVEFVPPEQEAKIRRALGEMP